MTDDEDDEGYDTCDVCGAEFDDHPDTEWVMLAAFSVGAGEGQMCVTFMPGDHSPLEIGDAGALMHWPGCAQMYLDAEIAKLRVEVRRMEEEGTDE